MKKVEKVIKRGIHKCVNGLTLPYSVTNFDISRREVTMGKEVLEKLQNGQINPMEIKVLLMNLYSQKIKK
jgi:hypothetical protein